MNRSFIVAVLTVTMLVMMSTASYAVIAPHNLACDNCHAKHLGTLPAEINNGCITCHSSTGEAPGKPMESDAMSNYFGSSANQPAKGSKSSHNWLATAPYDSRARVLEPSNAALNSGYQGYVINNPSNVFCIRCHYIKPFPSDTNPPLLRATNANDALCFDCHRQRITTTHADGSHPVAYRSYSAVYKLNTTAFRKVPKNANPNNRTSDLGKYFIAGQQIGCRTCHAPHYADSSSATLDNRSTAKGFGVDDPDKGLKATFQDSNGELLRTDRYGVNANSINICSSCHKETKNLNHNAKGQNIQCDHCHSAHVDGDGTTPNYYLVRRDFSNMSTPSVKIGPDKKVTYIYNGVTSLKFVRSDNKGICQVCHTVRHAVTDAQKADCIVCHKHSNGFSASDCNSCHGQPPMTNYVGGTDGKASQSYTVDESFTPHAIHADAAFYKYACKNCHYDGTRPDSHNTLASGTATFQSVFVDTAGSVGANAGFTNVPSDYNTTAKTCSNVYCHSNGNPRGGAAFKSVTTPGWELGKNKIIGKPTECTACHQYGNTLVTNAHYAHVTSIGVKCYVCHNATVNVNGAIDRTKHANGAKDVTFVTQPANFVGLFTASFNTSDASCTNTCHGSYTPVWTDPLTGQCGTCHAVPAESGSHTRHLTGTSGPMLGIDQAACVTCHDNVGNGKHANGQLDSPSLTTCTPCHPSSPVWANAASVTCESCHVGTASVVGSYIAPLKFSNATGHGKYALSSQCTACHDATKNHIGAGPTEKRLLIAGNALCDSCHTTAAGKGLPEARTDLLVHGGTVNAFTHYTTAADLANITAVRSDACSGCHDTHGTTNRMSIKTTINGLSVTYTGSTPSFIDTVDDGNGFYHGLCQVCHTRTKYFNRNIAPVTSHAAGNCLSCHTHKATHYAFEPTVGGCGGCHGYPPVAVAITRNPGTFGTQGNYSSAKFQEYSGGGGAHSVAGHIPKTADPNQAWSNCNNCHNDTSHATGGTSVQKVNVNVVVDPQYKFNNTTSITYNGNTCSNVSCHFKPSPNWVTGN